MGDVISFPTASHPGQHGNASMNGLTCPSAPDTDERLGAARRRAELLEVVNAIKGVSTFKTQEDVERVARNLTDMLREAKEVGVSGTEIAKKVWPKDISPSKRFDKLTIPRKAVPADSRTNRLLRRTSHYKEVAFVLGESVPGWSSQEALVRVFRGTSVDRELNAIIEGREARAADPDFCWRNLADMLASLAESVSRSVDLRSHLKRIAAMGGQYNLATNEIVPSHFDLVSGGNRLLHYGPLADDFALWEHFPPIPSVPIFDELLVPSFRHTLTVTSAESKDAIKIEVQVGIWREIRFAVGPVDEIEQAGALFEVRTRLELTNEESRIELPRPWLYLDADEEVEIRINDRAFVGTIDFSSQDLGGKSWKDLLMWRGMNVQSKITGEWLQLDLQPEHNYAAWRRVTPELCDDLMNRPKLNAVPLEFGIYFYTPSKEPTLTPEGTLAATLETALRVKDEPCLASTLFEEAKRLVSLVEDETKRRQNEAIKLNDRAATSWSEK
jgi:hypothetical protein